MTAIAPQLNHINVFPQINVILNQNKWIDEKSLDFRRIEKQVDDIFKVDPALGHAIYGFLYSLSGNDEYVRYHFDQVIGGVPTEVIDHNYIIALTNLGFFTEAQKIYRNFANPENGFFSGSTESGICCFEFSTLIEYANKAKKMHLEFNNEHLKVSEQVSKILTDNNLTDQDLAKYADVVGEVLRENKLFFKYAGPEIFFDSRDEDCSSVMFIYKVDTDTKTAVKLYGELIKKIVKLYKGMPQAVHFSISAV